MTMKKKKKEKYFSTLVLVHLLHNRHKKPLLDEKQTQQMEVVVIFRALCSDPGVCVQALTVPRDARFAFDRL